MADPQVACVPEGSNDATIGRSLSRVQISSLLGGAIGVVAAGFVFESSNRESLVLVFAALSVIGAALTAKTLARTTLETRS